MLSFLTGINPKAILAGILAVFLLGAGYFVYYQIRESAVKDATIAQLQQAIEDSSIENEQLRKQIESASRIQRDLDERNRRISASSRANREAIAAAGPTAAAGTVVQDTLSRLREGRSQ